MGSYDAHEDVIVWVARRCVVDRRDGSANGDGSTEGHVALDIGLIRDMLVARLPLSAASVLSNVTLEAMPRR